MSVTYTRAADRVSPRRGLLHLREFLAIVVASAVAVLALTVAYIGRLQAFDASDQAVPVAMAVNLSEHPEASRIESVLGRVFDNGVDRRLAAQAVAQATQPGGALESISNVGALARLRLEASEIEAARGARVYDERLRDARSRAPRATAVTSVPLFTAADLGAIKPGFIVRSRASHRWSVIWCGAAIVASFLLIAAMWQVTRRRGDPILLAGAEVLVTLGALVMLSRPDPLRDTLLLSRFAATVALAAAIGCAVSMLRMRTTVFVQLTYLSLAAALVLGVLLAVFGSGPGTSGAKVNLGPLQPVDVIRLLLAFFLAGYLGRRWEVIRQVRQERIRERTLPRWLDLPRIDHILPILGGVGLSLMLFFLLRDLGPALLLSLTVLILLAAARAGIGALLTGLVVLAGGFAAGYLMNVSSTLTSRVAMWRSPWENVVRGGDQIAQTWWALAAGGWSGTGLGLGDGRYLPAGHTDLVLAGIGEELGFVGLLIAAAAISVIALRGLRIARRAPTDTTHFLAVALTISLVVPALVMAAGILGLAPLTGVVTPFLSYGGSAMVVNFTALGLLAAIRSADELAVDARPFHAPVTWLGRGLGACALVLLIFAGRTQLLRADDTLVQPQLGIQADGGWRYQYNPRVLDAAATLPRGTVFDRRHVPIAGDHATVVAAEATFKAFDFSPRDVCRNETLRCYPLGGPAIHVLGDANTRMNWSAANTSYAERDAESRLRGFDDHATARTVTSPDGRSTVAIRRDYHDIVALVRHRWQPTHPDVVAIHDRPRDVTLTLDARLQVQVAGILGRAVTAAGLKKGAVVVLDADSGQVLASVAYPWPTVEASPPVGDESWLDRARYGLYPPGSTFKLITAAAALRMDPSSDHLAFTCSRLTKERVGVKLAGHGRPIRDDVLDHQPHGTLMMHDAMVRSCNAYFAQLAVKLGSGPIAAAADLAGVVFPTTGSAARQRETLPYAGYGQGDVLATPLRLARVAAAIGTDGQIREPSMIGGDPAPAEKSLLAPAAARELARFMRDVVTDGTGRLLSRHAVRIAGKTGTAEVDGAPSHAWFIGFAPAGPATQRIAFAVVLENAGYGGSAAASVAGQVVTAAASMGMVR